MLFKDITIINENYEVKHNKYVLVDGDSIIGIGDNMPRNYTGEVYEGNNKILSPGFFNTHCHAPMSLLRGYGEGLPLDRWLSEKIFPYEALLTEEDVYSGSLLGIAEMISSGCVSFTDMYFILSGICKAVDESGIKANVCQGFTSSADSVESMENITKGIENTDMVLNHMKNSSHDRIKCDMGIHAEYTSNVPLVKNIVKFAEDNDLGIHLHLSETAKEHEECKKRRGKTPSQYFEDLGVFGRPTNAAHCVWLDDEDFEILARNNVSIAHCPSSNLKLGSGIAKVRQMREAGINVAIGTDGAASNNNLNMLEEITLAAMVQKGSNMDPLFLSNPEIFEMACKNGAKAQGRENCGSIKVGNRADLIVFDADRPNMQPRIDDSANILFSAESSNVVLNMIDGNVVYKNGEFKTIDIEKVKFDAAKIAKEKLAKL